MTSQEKMARLTHAAPSASHSIYTAARGEQWRGGEEEGEEGRPGVDRQASFVALLTAC